MAEKGDQNTRLREAIVVTEGRKMGPLGGMVSLQVER